MANRIKTEREFLGLSQSFLAETVGISRAALSSIETGKRKVTASELLKFAQVYDVSPEELCGKSAPADDDETVRAIYRASKQLPEDDQQQILKFARFLRSSQD